MERQGSVMRFQEGIRTRHPAPEAVFESAPSDVPAAAGQALAVLVDLIPPLPHRSREIRVIAAETYWTSSGSVVARLRRALAMANRYLANANAQSDPKQKTTGNITCAAFFEDELFLGQVGAGHALLYQPKSGLERFPRDEEPLLPLGATLPPIIHIGYADVVPESTFLLATTDMADSVKLSRWAALLSGGASEEITKGIQDLMEARGPTGSCVLVQYTSEAKSEEPVARPSFLLPRRRKSSLPQEGSPEPPSSQTERAAAGRKRRFEERTLSQDQAQTSAPQTGAQPPAPAPRQRRNRPKLKLRLPKVQLPRLRSRKGKRPQKPGAKRKLTLPTLPKVDLKALIKPLLPGKVEGARTRRRRQVPEEKSTVMSGLTLGFLLIVLLITVTTYFQPRDEVLQQQADEAWQTALASQDVDDWEHLARISDQMLALDPQDSDAQMLRETAQRAIDAADDATILNATPIMELGTSPSPRHLIVAESWVYVLNPATDEIRGLPLQEDGIVPATEAPTPILREGQTVAGSPEPVGSLVDLAWMSPGPGYPDGAVLIYSDNGYLYIYEPHIGPSNIDHQKLEGDIHSGAITLIETYGGQFYALDRQANQVWKYLPVNGAYNGLPRTYFAENTAPQLQTALAMDLDGRLYLLLGDSAIYTYFRGTEDVSFRLEGIPVTDFQPTVMAIEPDPEDGMIYLGDAKQNALIAMNKRGQYQRQFRLTDESLDKLEALAVSEDPHVLYFVAANRLHAAPIPAAVNP